MAAKKKHKKYSLIKRMKHFSNITWFGIGVIVLIFISAGTSVFVLNSKTPTKMIPSPTVTVISPTQTPVTTPTEESTNTITYPTFTPTPTKSPYKFTLMKSEEAVRTRVPEENGGYAVYAILKDEKGNVVTNQTGYNYVWTVDNNDIIEGGPFTGCTFGIQPPCPNDHFAFKALKSGTATITAEVYTDQVIAKTSISVNVDYYPKP